MINMIIAQKGIKKDIEKAKSSRGELFAKERMEKSELIAEAKEEMMEEMIENQKAAIWTKNSLIIGQNTKKETKPKGVILYLL